MSQLGFPYLILLYALPIFVSAGSHLKNRRLTHVLFYRQLQTCWLDMFKQFVWAVAWVILFCRYYKLIYQLSVAVWLLITMPPKRTTESFSKASSQRSCQRIEKEAAADEGKAKEGGRVRLIKMECPILFSAPYFFSLQMEKHVLSPTSYLSLRSFNLHLSQRFPYSFLAFKITGFQHWTLCSEKNTTIMDERNLQTSTFRNDIKSVHLLQDMRSGCV